VQLDGHVTIARNSATVENALVRLHEAGASPIEAIKALREGMGLDLGQAKLALQASPAWHVEARSAEKLHDQALGALGDWTDL
jgi:ribosomal protein L7/L12